MDGGEAERLTDSGVGHAAGNVGEGAAVSLTMLPVLMVLIVWQLRRVRRDALA